MKVKGGVKGELILNSAIATLVRRLRLFVVGIAELIHVLHCPRLRNGRTEGAEIEVVR